MSFKTMSKSNWFKNLFSGKKSCECGDENCCQENHSPEVVIPEVVSPETNPKISPEMPIREEVSEAPVAGEGADTPTVGEEEKTE